MLKSLLSLLSILVLLLPSVFVPARTAACPIRLPETLLSLYKNSDAIYVARFDKAEDAEIIENTDERTVVNIRKHFDISSTLKGESRKFFILESQDYRYKNNGESTEVEEPVVQEPEVVEPELDDLPFGAGTLMPADLVLLFLKDGGDGKPLQLTDSRDGIKRMTPHRLESYEARIRELNTIFEAKKVDDTAIVDWLVRCTQDPATRWEGAYQLQRSFQQLAWLKQQEQEEKKESAEDAETVEETEKAESAEQEPVDESVATEAEAESETGEDSDDDMSAYARILSDAQKEALMRILIERMPTSERNSEKLAMGDKVLIEVVSNWGDRRFAKFLLDRLQGFGGEPYEVSELMSTIAKILSDDDLSKIADRYSNVFYEDDDDQVEPEESEDESEAGDSVAGKETAEAGSDAEPANETEPKDADSTRGTYKQLRDELFKNFVDRSLVVLAIATENEKVNE